MSTASLRPGMRLAQDLFDHSGVLVLAAGMQVTARFLSLLSQRQLKTVRIRLAPRPDLIEIYEEDDGPTTVDESAVAREIDEHLSESLAAAPEMHPVCAWRRPRLPFEVLRSEAVRGLERHAATSTMVADVGETLQAGGRVSCRKLQSSVRTFVDMVTVDFDLLPLIVSMQRTKDDYLFDHCVNTSMLAMTIAAQLGLNQEQIMEVGLSGLLQDIGMLRVPGDIRFAPRGATPSEWREIRRHPLHTLDMLENISGLPSIVCMISYQAHERGDGSGYPRGRGLSSLHPFAMIVAMADMFAAMTRPRPYRSAMMPYEAAKAILLDGSVEKFDRSLVRAFLDVVSLFPIGSIVELDNGVKAKVLRANADHHTRPIVEQLDERGQPLGQIIDLSTQTGLKVVRAYADPGNTKAPDTTGGAAELSPHGAALGTPSRVKPAGKPPTNESASAVSSLFATARR